MKNLKFVFPFILILLVTYTNAQPVKNALKLFEMKQFNQAKSAFINDVKKNNQAIDWFFLGKTYSILGKKDSATICFTKVAVLDPKNPLSTVSQAYIELAAKNNTQSLALLDKAHKYAQSDKDVNALSEVALARYAAGDTAGWKTSLVSASNINSKNIKPYLTAGNIYRLMADRFMHDVFIGLASGRFDQVLYNDPNNLEALCNLGELNIIGRNYFEAENYLSEVISKDSNYIPALKAYGELAYTLGKYEKASILFNRYMGIAEYTEKEVSRYVTILYFNKEYTKANGLISQILQKEPTNAVMLRLKGYTSYELGKYTEGEAAMKKFFELRSSSDTSKIISTDYEYMGRLFGKNGNDSLSIVNLIKAVEMDSTKAGLLEDIAKSYEKQKQYPQAVTYYYKFVASRKGNVAAATYFSIGRDLQLYANTLTSPNDSLNRILYLQRADTAFSKVITMSPNSHLGYLWHARVMAALDPETTQGLAKTDYEQALTILEQKNDPARYKSDLIEGYRYMGYYTYLQYDAAKTAKDDLLKEQAKTASTSFWQKLLNLDPENEVAKQAIDALK